jgi:Uncharacterised nucleotidyltransferase
MTDLRAKKAVLAALGHQPEFSDLLNLPPVNQRSGRNLLQWLDRSGLALSLLGQSRLSGEWLQCLNDRFTRNVERTRDMLHETHRINAAFRAFGITVATLKGFTLCPDFCDDPCLRHQVDFDYLVAPKSLVQASRALQQLGYRVATLNESGESRFYTPSRHVPSSKDDLYVKQHQRQVELHTSIWENCDWLAVAPPDDCLQNSQPQIIDGVEHLGLSLQDKFLFHVLHAFRHSFGTWSRISWLYEISHCIEKHYGNETLWNSVIKRAGVGALARSMFAFVLGLVNRLFRTRIPVALRSWAVDSMSLSLRAWLDHFAWDWAISDGPGRLSNLFLTPEFIPDRNLRTQYWRERLFPRKLQATIASEVTVKTGRFLQLQAARLSYITHRISVHIQDLAVLPLQQIRWKHALEACRRSGFGQDC